MYLRARPIGKWPEGWDRLRAPTARSPFKAGYSDTLDILDRELRHLRASEPTLQLDVGDSAIRLDGMLRADARPLYPGVILGFDTPRFGALSYPCNAYGWPAYGVSHPVWQDNLRAIALGLEALRKVERYGIAERGQQYRGYAELPSGIALGEGMTRDQAWAILRDGSGVTDIEVTSDNFEATVETLYRLAAKRAHPDNGGTDAEFQRLIEARDLLVG